jgi:hypothetical protein
MKILIISLIIILVQIVVGFRSRIKDSIVADNERVDIVSQAEPAALHPAPQKEDDDANYEDECADTNEEKAKESEEIKLYTGPFYPPGYIPEKFTRIPQSYWCDKEGNGGTQYISFESYYFDHISCKDGKISLECDSSDFNESYLFEPEFQKDGSVAFKSIEGGYLGASDANTFSCQDKSVSEINLFTISYSCQSETDSPSYILLKSKFGFIGVDEEGKLKCNEKLLDDNSQAWYAAEYDDKEAYDPLGYHYASVIEVNKPPVVNEPAPTEVIPSEPVPSAPSEVIAPVVVPSESAPSAPAPSVVVPSESAPSAPAPSVVVPSEPAPSAPAPSVVVPSEPAPSAPSPSDVVPSEPALLPNPLISNPSQIAPAVVVEEHHTPALPEEVHPLHETKTAEYIGSQGATEGGAILP